MESRTLDSSQKKEEARPQYLDVGRVTSGETSPIIELKETLELASAYKRIKGDAISSGQECGQALDSVLKRNLSRRLDSIVLVEETDSSIPRQYQARESVITRTPTRLATTSTPSSSPNPPPLPPKRCQNLAPINPLPPGSRSCSLSGSCSDVSSIQGDVFSDGTVDNPVPPFVPLPTGPAVHTAKVAPIITMEEAQNEILDEIDELNALMRSFDVMDIDCETLDDYKEKLAVIDRLLVKTDKDINKFIIIGLIFITNFKIH